MPYPATSSRIISVRFIPNKFPTLLAEREIIANAFLPTMSLIAARKARLPFAKLDKNLELSANRGNFFLIFRKVE